MFGTYKIKKWEEVQIYTHAHTNNTLQNTDDLPTQTQKKKCLFSPQCEDITYFTQLFEAFPVQKVQRAKDMEWRRRREPRVNTDNQCNNKH